MKKEDVLLAAVRKLSLWLLKMPLKFNQKVDIVGASTFGLALIAGVYTASEILRGSDPKLHRIERVLLFKNSCGSNSSPILNIVSPITVYNRSDKKFASVISNFRAELHLEKSYQFDKEYYVDWGEANDKDAGFVGCSKNDKDLIFYVKREKAFRKEILAGGAYLTNSVLLVPEIPHCPDGSRACYTRNYIDFSQFESYIRENINKNKKIKIDFRMTFDEDRHQYVECTLPIDGEVLRAVSNYKHIDMFCEEGRS